MVGSAVAPVIKITGNSTTYANMIDDMDFDAGKVLDGLCNQAELTQELVEMVCEVAAGTPSKSEALGHKEYFIPYKFQEKEVVRRACEK